MFTQCLAAQLVDTVTSAAGAVRTIVRSGVDVAIIIFCLGGKLDIEPEEGGGPC